MLLALVAVLLATMVDGAVADVLDNPMEEILGQSKSPIASTYLGTLPHCAPDVAQSGWKGLHTLLT